MNTFEYGGLSLSYDPQIGVYSVSDINYQVFLGMLVLQEGPGWIINISKGFLDLSQTALIAELLSALNSTIQEF